MAPQSVILITGCSSGIGATGASNAALPAGSIFSPLAEHIRGRAQLSQQGAMPARDFARRVAATVLADSAPVLVRGGPHSFSLLFLERWLPTCMLDRKLSQVFGLDRLRRVESRL